MDDEDASALGRKSDLDQEESRDNDTYPRGSDTHPRDSDTHPRESDTHPGNSDTDPWTEAGQLGLQEKCRLTIRECLISNSQGKFILPQLQRLYLPDRLKQFVSFYTYLEYIDFMASLNDHSENLEEILM